MHSVYGSWTCSLKRVAHNQIAPNLVRKAWGLLRLGWYAHPCTEGPAGTGRGGASCSTGTQSAVCRSARRRCEAPSLCSSGICPDEPVAPCKSAGQRLRFVARREKENQSSVSAEITTATLSSDIISAQIIMSGTLTLYHSGIAKTNCNVSKKHWKTMIKAKQQLRSINDQVKDYCKAEIWKRALLNGRKLKKIGHNLHLVQRQNNFHIK